MPTITKAHRIRLNPTKEQEDYFWKSAKVARNAYNWGLAEYNKYLDKKRKVSGRLLKKEYNKIKADQFPMDAEVTCWAYQGAFDDLQSAFRNFFDKKKKGLLNPPPGWKGRKGKPFGWPRFKSVYKSTPSFYLANTAFRFDDHLVKIPHIGWVNMAEPLRFEGKVLGARISYRAGHWWLSVQIEMEHEIPVNDGLPVGMDLGIKYLAVTSDGQTFDNPKAYEKAQKKLRRLQRKLDRQRRVNNPNNYNENGTVKKGITQWYKSQAMIETEQRIAKLHFRVACIRNEAAHEMTTQVTKEYSFIGVENLNIKGMVKNRRLAKAVSDAAMSEKRRQLEYKAAWNGGRVVAVDQWFASSKICHNCGWVHVNLKLSDRVWTCGGCGQVNLRDKNAAKNIRDEALRIAGLL